MEPKIRIENEYTVENSCSIDEKLEWILEDVENQLENHGCNATDDVDAAIGSLLSLYGDDCNEDDIHQRVIFDETAGLYVDDENANYSVRVEVTELYVDSGSDFYEYAVNVELV